MRKNSLSHTQTQNQTQTQTLSPQQVLQVRILELTTVELEDKVRSEIMENPALEAIEPEPIEAGGIIQGEEGETNITSADDYRTPDDIPEYAGWEHRSSGGAAEEIPVSAGTSFGEILLEQLGELPLNESERAVGEYLVGSLEEDLYELQNDNLYPPNLDLNATGEFLPRLNHRLSGCRYDE